MSDEIPERVFDPVAPEIDFFRWAFGTDAFEKNIDLMERWNTRHGHLLKLKQNGWIKEDMIKMGAIWASQGYPTAMAPIEDTH